MPLFVALQIMDRPDDFGASEAQEVDHPELLLQMQKRAPKSTVVQFGFGPVKVKHIVFSLEERSPVEINHFRIHIAIQKINVGIEETHCRPWGGKDSH